MSKLVEEWRPIEGYEGLYEVSDWGRIKSLEKKYFNGKGWMKIEEHIMKVYKDKDGYELVRLKKNGDGSTLRVHRIVGQTFIPNDEGKPVIDHIDGNTSNNCVWNLRWCTQKENLNYPLARKNISNIHKICVLKRKRNSLGQFI